MVAAVGVEVGVVRGVGGGNREVVSEGEGERRGGEDEDNTQNMLYNFLRQPNQMGTVCDVV